MKSNHNALDRSESTLMALLLAEWRLINRSFSRTPLGGLNDVTCRANRAIYTGAGDNSHPITIQQKD